MNYGVKGSKSKDGRYEKELICDNPLAIAMYGVATEVEYPYPLFDVQTWGKKKFWQTRDVKAAWLYDRITGSRKTGIGNRADNPELYHRGKLSHENMKDKLVDECPLCNVKMNYGRGFNKTHNEVRGIVCRPSIDRIDSNKGYEPDNVWVICFDCNTEKR
jgi:hypothetical protein